MRLYVLIKKLIINKLGNLIFKEHALSAAFKTNAFSLKFRNLYIFLLICNKTKTNLMYAQLYDSLCEYTREVAKKINSMQKGGKKMIYKNSG